MESKRKLPLAFWIFVGLLVGIAAGMALMNISVGGIEGKDFAKAYIKPWGDIFLNLLKFVVVPIVLFSIAAGVISMKDISKVGSIGLKTIVYYMCTTAFAVILALILASVAKGMHWFPLLETSGLSYEAPAGQSFMDTIVSIFPSNAVQPLASATMLQVIVISLFLGFGVLLAGEKGLATAQIVDSLNEVFIKIMDVIIRLSPIGVACLICPVVAENGPKILSSLLTVLLVAYGGYIIHAAVVYSSIGPPPPFLFSYVAARSGERPEKNGVARSERATVDGDTVLFYKIFSRSAIPFSRSYGNFFAAGRPGPLFLLFSCRRPLHL